jgi:hypothetical protein
VSGFRIPFFYCCFFSVAKEKKFSIFTITKKEESEKKLKEEDPNTNLYANVTIKS